MDGEVLHKIYFSATMTSRNRAPQGKTVGNIKNQGKNRIAMPTLVLTPTKITAAGNKPKLIEEYIGRVNSRTASVSVARMRSPAGWVEPGQRPAFDEYTVVLSGMLRVEHASGAIDVVAGQAIIAHAGEWVRYSSPLDEGAEYIAICLPAFSPDTVHRDSL